VRDRLALTESRLDPTVFVGDGGAGEGRRHRPCVELAALGHQPSHSRGRSGAGRGPPPLLPSNAASSWPESVARPESTPRSDRASCPASIGAGRLHPAESIADPGAAAGGSDDRGAPPRCRSPLPRPARASGQSARAWGAGTKSTSRLVRQKALSELQHISAIGPMSRFIAAARAERFRCRRSTNFGRRTQVLPEKTRHNSDLNRL
jgi:hypothetical protein